VIIRNAKIDDIKDVYKWRNDSLSRSMFVDSSYISIAKHKLWFNNTLTNPNKEMYIGLVKGEKIGVTRFDFDEKLMSTEVSINLNPLMRRKNLSSKLLSKSISLYLKNKNTILLATVKNQNISSLKIFKKLGFKKNYEDKKYQYLIFHKKS
jgi:RimJ/RimL family protein N-acetyltransferase